MRRQRAEGLSLAFPSSFYRPWQTSCGPSLFFIAITFMVNVLFLGVLSHRKNDKGTTIDQAIDQFNQENNLSVPKGE